MVRRVFWNKDERQRYSKMRLMPVRVSCCFVNSPNNSRHQMGRAGLTLRDVATGHRELPLLHHLCHINLDRFKFRTLTAVTNSGHSLIKSLT